MIFAQCNADHIQTTLIVIVLEPDNLERMEQADPVTLESGVPGGFLQPIKYPERVRLMIASEKDVAPIYEMIQQQRDGELLTYLMRGYQFKAVDGKQGGRPPLENNA